MAVSVILWVPFVGVVIIRALLVGVHIGATDCKTPT